MTTMGKKLLATFGLLTFLAIMPMSCGVVCLDTCGCNPSFPQQKLLIRSFEVLTIAGNGQRIQPTLTQPFDQVFKAFRIKDFELISFENSNLFEPWSLGTAFACSPPPIYAEEKLVQVQIFNLKEVTLGDGTSIALGEDISPYFGINDFFAQGLVPVNQFLSGGRTLILEDFFKLGFIKNPGKEISLELSIRLLMDNGEEFILGNQILSIR